MIISHSLIFDQSTTRYGLSSDLHRTKSRFFLNLVPRINPSTLIIPSIKSNVASFYIEIDYVLLSLNIEVDLYSSSLICVIGLVSGKLEYLLSTIFDNNWNGAYEITPT